MFGRLRQLRSFGAKVMLLVTATAGVAVIAVSLIAGLRDYLLRREQLIETIAVQAQIVAANSSAPLAFGDVDSAFEALDALRFADAVTQAVLIDDRGRVFARFERRGKQPEAEPLLPVGHWERAGDAVLVLPVADRSGEHGRLQVHYVEDRLHREAWVSAALTALFSAAAMLLAWLLARRARTLLTAPIVELDRTAQQVTEHDDYSARAARLSNDELGRLTDSFNALLGHVEASRRQLIEAHRKAEQASRLKDEFVATLSHELRTPMSPIMAWTQLLRLRGTADPKLEQGLEVIERNARMLIQIIDDLLDMSRIISGNLRLDVQQVDLGQVVHAALETVAAAADSRRVELDVRIDPAVSAVRGDPARLQQVLWNLLSNAIKFTPKEGRVQVRLSQAESQVVVSVSDTGAGIEPQFLPFVFDRFRQQDGSVTREHGGLGLGLAIAKQLVELHGGDIHASSPGPGGGATFIVRLPVAPVLEPTLPAATAELPQPRWQDSSNDTLPSLEGLDVLVVEDHADMRSLIRQVLEQAGASVRDASTLADALRQFEQRAPDMLISDIGLPGGDGYALIRAIRSRPDAAGGRVPAIALTAYARTEDRARALLAGFELHVAKPVEPIELLAATARLARGDSRPH